MPTNPILEELYAVRRDIMEEHGDDLAAYLHGEFERLKKSGHPIANIKQRTMPCTGMAVASVLTLTILSRHPVMAGVRRKGSLERLSISMLPQLMA